MYGGLLIHHDVVEDNLRSLIERKRGALDVV
jgi:hypothetical protein